MSIIAIDYGGRRIGVAVSDSGTIASPHSVVKNEGEIIDKLARIASELDAETIVVGIARRTRSERGDQKFRDFAERLRQKTCKPVVLWNEALSTVEAARQLRESGTKRRDAQREIDMHAAAVILQSYLDAQDRRAS
ncbi:MAG TPA: Holliday junction resolvase RuvX [Thermoanaerobaculia bacterium]|jgi:putative Holliday junction resolvase|nr:Holliday junction resolvase RuvX [Thermoanaerobaculia bacterium]